MIVSVIVVDLLNVPPVLIIRNKTKKYQNQCNY